MASVGGKLSLRLFFEHSSLRKQRLLDEGVVLALALVLGLVLVLVLVVVVVMNMVISLGLCLVARLALPLQPTRQRRRGP